MGACSAFFRMHPLLSDGLPELFPEGFFTSAGETVAMDLTLDEPSSVEGGPGRAPVDDQEVPEAGLRVPHGPTAAITSSASWRSTGRRWTGSRRRSPTISAADYFARLAGMPGHVHCGVVESEGRPAAACIFFECGGIVQAHLGGTRSEFLNKSPFHLLLYSRRGMGQGPRQPVPPPGGRRRRRQRPLLQFKRGFSPLLFPFSTLRLVTDERRVPGADHAPGPGRRRAGGGGVLRDFFPAYRAPVRGHAGAGGAGA